MSSPSLEDEAYLILCNNATLPNELLGSIRDVRVEHEISVPGMFSFTLGMMSASGAWQGANLDVFKPGDTVAIRMGSGQLHQMIVGQITAIEPRFAADSVVTIRGFDRMYGLKFGTRTRVFENLSESDIAQDVAGSIGLRVRTEGRATTINSYVKQYRQSNYEFLIERCRQINYELMIDGTTLVFRPSGQGASPVRSLSYPKDLIHVDLDLRVPTAGSTVTVYGFNAETNETISAVSRGGTQSDLMGGQVNGYAMAARFPDSAITLERGDIANVEALQTIADAGYQTDLEAFIEGSASLNGDPDIVAGVNVKLDGLTDRFNGTYYVTSSVHAYDNDSGYTTEIKLRRTGA